MLNPNGAQIVDGSLDVPRGVGQWLQRDLGAADSIRPGRGSHFMDSTIWSPMTDATVHPTSLDAAFHRPPSKLLQLLELRAFSEFGASLALLPLLRTAPRGDGHAVLVLPGLIASDTSTSPLRAYLADRGYEVHGWGLGRNLGLRPGLEEKMKARLREIRRNSGRKVSIVGWSLGGVYAREIARAVPDAVRNVITLGSPIHGDPRSTNAWRVYELASGQSVDDPRLRRPRRAAPPVPTSSIYSRTDGVVAWQCSVEPTSDYAESIEVIGSHCGLGVNAAVLYAIADRLAQPEGEWKRFDRSGLRSWVFPDPCRQDSGARRASAPAAMPACYGRDIQDRMARNRGRWHRSGTPPNLLRTHWQTCTR